ncbi:(Fe-S)-binding protein [Thermodesulfobacteriota bacterium]
MDKRFSSLREFFDYKRQEYVDKCIPGCSNCYDVCSSIPFTKIKDEDPTEVQEKVIELLRDKKYSPEAEERFMTCFYCGLCGPVKESCPAGIANMRVMLPIGRTILKELGRSLPAGTKRLDPGNKHANLYVMNALQMKPSEKTWLSPEQIPDKAEKVDVALFTGCTPHNTPNILFTMMDIFDKMGVSYVALGGGGFCCGNMHQLMGDYEGSERYMRQLYDGMMTFNPDTVVSLCGTCHYQMTDFFTRIMDMPKIQYITDFFLENFDKIEPHLTPVKNQITLHESCNMPRYVGDSESIRQLLGKIPGLDLVEMEHIKEETICCGGGAYYLLGLEGGKHFADQRLNEARDTGADTLVCGGCQGCYYIFIGRQDEYSYDIVHWMMVLGESMGIKHEETLKKYFTYDPEKILEESKENIEASRFSLEEMEELIPKMFKGKNLLTALDED